MKKRFIPIYSILAIAIILLGAFVPSCSGPTPATGTIVVQATLCGVPWPVQGTAAVNYTLTPAGGAATNGAAVPTTHSNMTATTWTCAHVSGGPPGAFLKSIKPSASQGLVASGTITFTLDFELRQDAAIRFATWTLNGVEFQGPVTEILAMPCMILDTHFRQWVKGCDGYNVTMNETSWLTIAASPANPGPVTIIAVDDWCAVNKTPAPRQKLSQFTTFNNVTAPKLSNITVFPGMPAQRLDVHTQWQLAKGTNYTKNINWFGIWFNQYEPGLHNCTLFEMITPPGPGVYQFLIQAGAEVAIVGDTDVDPSNNHDTSGQPVLLIVNVM